MKSLFILLLFFSVNVFSQTKEETSAWIREKLEKYGGGEESRLTVEKVTPCLVQFIENYDSGASWTNSFNLIEAGKWRAGSYYIMSAKNMIRQIRNDDAGHLWFNGIEIRNEEENIHLNMIAAFNHLATFCSEEKK